MGEGKREKEQFFEELLETDFFRECIRLQDGKRALLCGEMLLQQYYGEYSVTDFTEKTIWEFSKRLEACFTDKQKNILASAVEYLSDAFYGTPSVKIKKEDIPFLIFLAELAQEEEIAPDDFWKWRCSKL